MSSLQKPNMFLLLTPRLIIIPTTQSIDIEPYRLMYGPLHSLPQFCEMAFGHHLPASSDWTPEFTLAKMAMSNSISWDVRGMGDMAVGLLHPVHDGLPAGRSIADAVYGPEVRIIEGGDCEKLLKDKTFINSIQWAGYVGVRDATTTSLEPRRPDQAPFDPWQEMIELRYGVAPAFWGKGIAPEAARAAMGWAIQERKVKRFIAETLRDNSRSGGCLQRLGFVETGSTQWFGEDDLIEWQMVVA